MMKNDVHDGTLGPLRCSARLRFSWFWKWVFKICGNVGNLSMKISASLNFPCCAIFHLNYRDQSREGENKIFVWEKKKKWCWYVLDDARNFLFCVCMCVGKMLLISRIVQGIFWPTVFHHFSLAFPEFSLILCENREKKAKKGQKWAHSERVVHVGWRRSVFACIEN